MENKDFWNDRTQDKADMQIEQSVTVADRLEEPQEEWRFDIESILADMRKKTESSVQPPAQVPTMETTYESSVVEIPVEEPDDRQIMREMLLTMRELTEEIKLIRSQIETRTYVSTKPYDPANYPSERPPGLVACEEDNSSSEIKQDAQSEQKMPEKKNKVVSIISTVMFYVVIVVMVLGAFLMRSTSKGEPFMIAGFSAANVLTSSMEDVYPRGSLIVTQQVDAKELQIGDDITFMVSEDSSITHRIIGITEVYQETGARAFQTQGTMNPYPDKDMVAAANVVGKVIFHSKVLGDFANFVKENWPILLFVLIVIMGLISFLKWNAKRPDGDDEETEDKKKEKKTKSNKIKHNKHSERRKESNGDE